jgi:muramoyltetrapeptide carboxypeptidase
MKKIRIIAPAKTIEKEYVLFAKTFLEDNGFEVEISKHCLGQYHYFSGTDKERIFDFQHALDDESVDYILCARGGYGCVRIIDKIDFTKFKKKPKLIFGFSDVTVFHNHIHTNLDYQTVHSSVPLNFKDNSKESLASLIDVFNNQGIKYTFPAHPLSVFGSTKAKVVGGNLSVLYSLIGTDSDINFDGKILFIEDLAESIYAIDRMMWSFKKANKLNHIVGLIVGGFTNINDTKPPFGKSVEEIILEHTKNLNIPVCFSFPAGHIKDNRTIILGHEATLNINKKEVIFEQSPLGLTM